MRWWHKKQNYLKRWSCQIFKRRISKNPNGYQQKQIYFKNLSKKIVNEVFTSSTENKFIFFYQQKHLSSRPGKNLIHNFYYIFYYQLKTQKHKKTTNHFLTITITSIVLFFCAFFLSLLKTQQKHLIGLQKPHVFVKLTKTRKP